MNEGYIINDTIHYERYNITKQIPLKLVHISGSKYTSFENFNLLL